MSQMIISANKTGEPAGKPWRVRDSAVPMSQAEYAAQVVAKDVSFVSPPPSELSYGCREVAESNLVTMHAADESVDQPEMQQLQFIAGEMCLASTGQRIRACQQLILRRDGSMWAVLTA